MVYLPPTNDWAAWLGQQAAAPKAGQEGTRPSWQAVGGGQAAGLSQQVAGAGKGARQMPRKGLQAEQEGRHCCLFGTFLMTGPFCGQKLLNIGFGTRWMGTRSK